MLESLINLNRLIHNPSLAAIWAFLLGSVAILVSLQVSFDVLVAEESVNLAGIFAVLFTIIPAAYFITQIIRKEEIIEEIDIDKHNLIHTWRRHGLYLLIMLFFFAGITLSFFVWSLAFPDETFQIQRFKISQIRGDFTGAATGADAFFSRIFSNNMNVLIISYLFSFIFGAGAVFILVWNASVVGVFLSQVPQHQILDYSLGIVLHGFFEIGGYVVAGLAGGILSTAIIRGTGWPVLRTIAFDSLKLLLLASAMILLGAGIEAYL